LKRFRAVREVSRYPVILKVSATQDYVAIARGVVTFAEAIAINSVAWEKVFPKKKSPLAKLEARLKRDTGAGGGEAVFPQGSSVL